MAKQLAILVPERKKLLWGISLVLAALVASSAFANREAIKRGWRDGSSFNYQPPAKTLAAQ